MAARQYIGVLMVAGSRNPRHGALDAVLGERIRRRRRELQLSQSALGAKLGITFQQVQKYENGTNRVSATMLIKVSEALQIPILDLLQDVRVSATPQQSGDESTRLVADFARIKSPEMRQAVLTLVSGLGR
jgi:transcriptional regulator with XRE-family HTH domain